MTERELADRTAIHDVLCRYARGVDTKDVDLVASCFTSDCAYEGSLGKSTIAEALANLRSAMARYTRTMHCMGNQLIELTGAAAASETYCIARHELPDRRTFTVSVRYLDRLICVDGGWRIAQRTAITDWRRYDAPTEVP